MPKTGFLATSPISFYISDYYFTYTLTMKSFTTLTKIFKGVNSEIIKVVPLPEGFFTQIKDYLFIYLFLFIQFL